MENKTAYQPKTLFRCRQWHIFSTGKSCSLCGNRCSPYTDFASLSPPSIVRPPVPCFDCFFFQSVVCRSPVGKLSAACPRVIYNSAPDSATSRVAGVASDRVGVHFYAHIKTIPPSETRLSLDLEFCVAAKGARFQFSHLSSPPMLSPPSRGREIPSCRCRLVQRLSGRKASCRLHSSPHFPTSQQ